MARLVEDRSWPHARPSVPAVLVLTGALAITAWAARSAREDGERELHAYFEFRVRDAEARVAQRMAAYEQVLRGAAGLFAASGDVGRGAFRDYVASLRLAENHPGIQGVGFSVIVPAASREAHTARVQREGFPDYSIRPAGDRDVYSSIVYLEPFVDRNLRAFGYDMFSEPVRRAAMEQARDTGEPALSGRVRLVQETDRDVQAGAVMYLPVYRGGPRGRTLPERRAELVGWVYSAFRMRDLMHGIFGERGSDLDIELFDGTEVSPATLMYDADDIPLEHEGAQVDPATRRRIVVSGRTWTMDVRPLPPLMARVHRPSPVAVAMTGSVASVLLALVVWLLARGRARAVGEARDLAREVAERERAESALRESEALYRSLFTLAPSGVVLLDVEGRILNFNDQAHEQLGYGRDEFARLRVQDLNVDRSSERVLESLRSVADEGELELEVCHRTRSGETRRVLVRRRRVEKDGEALLLAVWQDITDRKRAEEAQRASEARLRQTLRYAKAGTWEWDLATDACVWSPEIRELLGLGHERATPTNREWRRTCVHPEDLPGVDAAIRAVVAGEAAEYRAEYRILHPQRGLRWIVGVGQIERAPDGTPRRLLGLSLDITERKEAEEALRRSEARLVERAAELEAVLDAVPAAVMITRDRDARTIHSNRLGHELLRVEPGRAVSKTAPPAEAPTGFRVFQNGAEVPPTELPVQVAAARGVAVANSELEILFDDGTARHLLGNARPLLGPDGRPSGAVGAFVDVTDLKQAQARLMQSDRLASVGMLAAGVAHEINNPLAYVVAALNFLEGELSRLDAVPGPALREMRQALADARDGARRVTHVVRDLKTFSRADEEHRTLVDLPSVLESAINLASSDIKYRARIVRDYGAVPKVEANEARLGQVFVNLLVNAAQAIPEGHVDENEIRVATGTDPLGRAIVEVRDSGSGIPPGIVKHVFDPFFTTKPVNVGTGLGLSICRNIVSALGGEITVESGKGSGSVFRVALPAARARPEARPEPAHEVDRGRRGRILVVDDEPAIAHSIHRLLGAEHEVLTRTSAREALELIARGERFDVILCDLIMPNVTGMDLHSELTSVAPDQARRLVVLTGGAFTPRATQFLDAVPNVRIEKPFDPETLRRVVRTCVGEGPFP